MPWWRRSKPKLVLQSVNTVSQKTLRVYLFYRAEASYSQFTSYKDRTQSQVLASCKCVDDSIPVHLGDLAKDCQVRDLSKGTLQLPMIYCAIVRDGAILDI